ncbi:MAG: efflux transporter outer membrane subunit [Burkholderiaceae bacterium]|nr:efflux transporter outer membrane subunit [Burkholderiaceae bacterium]
MKHIALARAATWVLVASLAACASAPNYQPPQLDLKDDAWRDNPWQPAAPADEQPHGAWWQTFGDAELDALQVQLEQGSPDLAVALARFDQATAYMQAARAALLPSLDSAASVTGNRQSKNRPLRGSNQPDVYGANTIGISMSYELDLWGRVRSLVASGEALAQASAADLQAVRLSLHAQLTESYVSLRGVDTELLLLRETVLTYERALQLTRNRHGAGISSGLDVARAQTQLSSAQALVSELEVHRAQLEHAIASLLGEPAQSFQLAVRAADLKAPELPVGQPSTLLQRRPDVAAAERRVASANAAIGVARAAFFPTFTFGPSYGFQNTGGENWISAPNRYWSIGPAVNFNLFDAGLRKSQLAQARAAWDEAGARYRSVVMNAFQQVEDEMARLSLYKVEIEQQTQAETAAHQALQLAMSRYRDGAIDYLEVVSAQTTDLQIRRAMLNLQNQRLLSSVRLVRALGGGWDKNSLALPSPTSVRGG